MKAEIVRLVFELIGGGLMIFFATKQFRFKTIITTLITAAKDGRVTEEEFQQIVDEVKKEIY